MVAAGITTSPRRLLLIRFHQAQQSGRWMSKLAGTWEQRDRVEISIEEEEEEEETKKSSCWIPHPRTGIYFPEGHERVMDDIPNGAATLTPTYWLRSEEGVDVDKPGPDFPFHQGSTCHL